MTAKEGATISSGDTEEKIAAASENNRQPVKLEGIISKKVFAAFTSK